MHPRCPRTQLVRCSYHGTIISTIERVVPIFPPPSLERTVRTTASSYINWSIKGSCCGLASQSAQLLLVHVYSQHQLLAMMWKFHDRASFRCGFWSRSIQQSCQCPPPGDEKMTKARPLLKIQPVKVLIVYRDG